MQPGSVAASPVLPTCALFFFFFFRCDCDEFVCMFFRRGLSSLNRHQNSKLIIHCHCIDPEAGNHVDMNSDHRALVCNKKLGREVATPHSRPHTSSLGRLRPTPHRDEQSLHSQHQRQQASTQTNKGNRLQHIDATRISQNAVGSRERQSAAPRSAKQDIP